MCRLPRTMSYMPRKWTEKTMLSMSITIQFKKAQFKPWKHLIIMLFNSVYNKQHIWLKLYCFCWYWLWFTELNSVWNWQLHFFPFTFWAFRTLFSEVVTFKILITADWVIIRLQLFNKITKFPTFRFNALKTKSKYVQPFLHINRLLSAGVVKIIWFLYMRTYMIN